MSRMHNPSHPGAILADTVLRKDGGITVTDMQQAYDLWHAQKKRRPRIERLALAA